MKIATWNINGIKARLEGAISWVKQADPDVLCLEEIKSLAEGFPTQAFEDLGYHLAINGQKGFNGVSILSKWPLEDVVSGLPGDDDDDHARYLEAVVSQDGGAVRVAAIYLPNGNPIDSERFHYKLAWMDRLIQHVKHLLAHEEPLVLAGDYNVIPATEDVHNPAAWERDALFRPESRARFRALLNLGLTDAFRACHHEQGQYTFWDYQAGAWARNRGIRIDHLLLSPQAADRLTACEIDRFTRSWDRPSDHVPVWADLASAPS